MAETLSTYLAIGNLSGPPDAVWAGIASTSSAAKWVAIV